MGQAQRARVCALQVVALIAHTRTGQPVLFSRPDYYHPLTFCCFCGIMEEGTLYGAADYGRLLPKCQILLTDGANCGTIMVEECTLVRAQTTTPHPDYYGRGGILIPSAAAHPDYYTHAAGAGCRLLSSRKQDPDYYMYEAGQISSRKQQKQQEAGAGIGCRLW